MVDPNNTAAHPFQCHKTPEPSPCPPAACIPDSTITLYPPDATRRDTVHLTEYNPSGASLPLVILRHGALRDQQYPFALSQAASVYRAICLRRFVPRQGRFTDRRPQDGARTRCIRNRWAICPRSQQGSVDHPTCKCCRAAPTRPHIDYSLVRVDGA